MTPNTLCAPTLPKECGAALAVFAAEEPLEVEDEVLEVPLLLLLELVGLDEVPFEIGADAAVASKVNTHPSIQ